MSQYTPGPWQWFENDGAHYVDTVSGNKPIADLDSIVRGGRSEVAANAQLIASSPELLSSAISVIEWYDGFKKLHEQTADVKYLANLRHAIAKAEGGA